MPPPEATKDISACIFLYGYDATRWGGGEISFLFLKIHRDQIIDPKNFDNSVFIKKKGLHKNISDIKLIKISKIVLINFAINILIPF